MSGEERIFVPEEHYAQISIAAENRAAALNILKEKGIFEKGGIFISDIDNTLRTTRGGTGSGKPGFIPDDSFALVDELKQNYVPKGVTPDKDVICYCRIGERSSHSWFVLKYLLGYPQVRNYDGSWTEWGNMIGNPVEK